MIFASVRARHGYEDVGAEFADLEDFKVRWQRSYNWIRFTVSDYLDRAPDDVLASLAEVLFTNLADAGTELDTLRRMMRHSHIDTTVNHYLKADPRKMKSATTAVDDALDL